ncbi:uncharacterized protein LOC127734433 [Mytilus californianus]|uniref:uncharacterized protein LOC127734433 n=1 Tax=Mytilus californianus TaxID=6549 RepID=UPI00224713AB|nr:uncharacterized protein LOC127734433 [Mytilus californianus]
MKTRRNVYIITAVIYMVLIRIIACYTVDLFFNSNNCDEYARRLPEDKIYTLTWSGKTDPKLCAFNFTGGEDHHFLDFTVCFESEEFDFPSFDVELVVTNATKRWVYDSSDDEIDRICVAKARDMMFKLVVSKNYQESSSKLKLKITSEVKVNVADIWDQVGKAIKDMIPVAIVVIILLCVVSNKRARQQCCSVITSVKDKIMGTTVRPRRDSIGNSAHSVPLHVDETRQNYSPSELETAVLQNSPAEPGGSAIPQSDSKPDAPPPSYDEVVKNPDSKNDIS